MFYKYNMEEFLDDLKFLCIATFQGIFIMVFSCLVISALTTLILLVVNALP